PIAGCDSQTAITGRLPRPTTPKPELRSRVAAKRNKTSSDAGSGPGRQARCAGSDAVRHSPSAGSGRGRQARCAGGPATGRRDSTIRKRPATKAPSVREALAAGLAPVAWKSENAADWLTQMLPTRLQESATPTSWAAASAAARTASDVE